jgi:hypothetical protein
MRHARLALAACLCGAALACERFDDAPRLAAERFWQALAAGDQAAARDLATPDAGSQLGELAAETPVREAWFGETLRNESSALVETTVVLEDDQEVSFHTVLASADGAWRVDARRTRRELTRAALATSVEQLRESVRGGAEALAEQVERGALEFSEALREALEELEGELRGEPPAAQPPQPPQP